MTNLTWLLDPLSQLHIVAYVNSFLNLLISDTTILVLFLTVTTYTYSNLVFLGYLFGIVGGVRGTLISQIGFTPIDFVLMIPMLLFTVIDLTIRLAWVILSKLLISVVLLFFSFAIPIVIASLLPLRAGEIPNIIVHNALVLVYLGLLFITSMKVAELITAESVNIRRSTISLLILVVAQTFILYSASVFNPPSFQTGEIARFALNPILNLLLEVVITVNLFLYTIAIPIGLGQAMAKKVKHDHLLHMIAHLSLSQALPTLVSHFIVNPSHKGVAYDTATYGSVNKNLIFLIASFPSLLVIGRTEDGDATSIASLIFIKNDLVLSYELAPAPSILRPKSNTIDFFKLLSSISPRTIWMAIFEKFRPKRRI